MTSQTGSVSLIRYIQGLLHWKNFFATHKKYRKVGRVLHHPIDPASPIPEHCQPEKAGKSTANSGGAKTDPKPEPQVQIEQQGHVEL